MPGLRSSGRYLQGRSAWGCRPARRKKILADHEPHRDLVQRHAGIRSCAAYSFICSSPNVVRGYELPVATAVAGTGERP
jgi:hypothetical protein